MSCAVSRCCDPSKRVPMMSCPVPSPSHFRWRSLARAGRRFSRRRFSCVRASLTDHPIHGGRECRSLEINICSNFWERRTMLIPWREALSWLDVAARKCLAARRIAGPLMDELIWVSAFGTLVEANLRSWSSQTVIATDTSRFWAGRAAADVSYEKCLDLYDLCGVTRCQHKSCGDNRANAAWLTWHAKMGGRLLLPLLCSQTHELVKVGCALMNEFS